MLNYNRFNKEREKGKNSYNNGQLKKVLRNFILIVEFLNIQNTSIHLKRRKNRGKYRIS